MKVQTQPLTFDVFHLQSRDDLPELYKWLREREWLMQIQDWENSGFFRPENYIHTNYFDEYFSFNRYILAAPIKDGKYGIHRLHVVDSLDRFVVIEE